MQLQCRIIRLWLLAVVCHIVCVPYCVCAILIITPRSCAQPLVRVRQACPPLRDVIVCAIRAPLHTGRCTQI